MAIFVRCEISSTNVADLFLNLTIRKSFKLVPQCRDNRFPRSGKRQDNKHAIQEKRHIVTANSDVALINFDTFGLSFSPLDSPCLPCSIPQAFRSSRYRRWLRFPRSPYSAVSIFILLTALCALPPWTKKRAIGV